MVMRLKVITFNIHKGYGPFNKNYELSRIRQLLKSIDADIIFLQEIHGHHPQNYLSAKSPLEELADTYWPHYRHGVNSIYPSNFHGNAILSRHPIVQWSNTDISTNSLERRGLLFAQILYEEKVPVDLFCTHLNLFVSGQLKQWKQIQRLIHKYQHADHCLFAGDFNDWASLSHKFLSHDFHSLPKYKTYPSQRPVLSLDRMYYKGFELVSSCTLKDYQESSDHLPIFADFTSSGQ
jgi:endonuclease/exonuclease/phosphatase family metal-dependent hydrolase